MLKVGLTGGIASGKNFVASLFREKGWHVLDSDEVSRRVMAQGTTAFSNIVTAFGSSILTKDGELDRSVLRQLVTGDTEKRILLESIVHPAVRKQTEEEIKALSRKDSNGTVLYHAPLLIEAGVYKFFDLIILVWCEPEVQRLRLKERGYPPYEEGLKLMEAQMTHDARLNYAHHVINNNRTREDTHKEVERVYSLIKMLRR